MITDRTKGIGYIISDVSDHLMGELKNASMEGVDVINSQQTESIHQYAANDRLAGNIEFEYFIHHNEHLSSLITQEVLGMIPTLNRSCPEHPFASALVSKHAFKLDNLWFNFQKKHEFNPPHFHSGMYSFVIWVSVPFLMENEVVKSPLGRSQKNNKAGCFEFLYPNPYGRIGITTLPVDKRFEGKMCLFYSDLVHTVYPFYSSDDFRISVSGNLTI